MIIVHGEGYAKKGGHKMRKIRLINIMAVAALAAVLAAGCGGKNNNETKVETSEEETSEAESETAEPESSKDTNAVGIPNPFIDCDSIEDAEKEAGFTLESPTFDDLENKTYQAIKGEMIQVFNKGEGAPDDGGILVRKALIEAYKDEDKTSEESSVDAEEAENTDGTEIVDVSGDYNDYDVTETMEINGMTVIAKGETADSYSVVIWNDGTYAYAMDMTEISIPAELIETYVPIIK